MEASRLNQAHICYGCKKPGATEIVFGIWWHEACYGTSGPKPEHLVSEALMRPMED